MTNTTFETKVLTQLDDINGRLNRIERRILGSEDDPNNRGIYGALTEVTEEVDAINKRHQKVTEEVDGVKRQQARQKAWLLGAAAGATFAGFTSVASLVKLSGGF